MAQSVKCVKVLPPMSQNDHCTIIMECLFRGTTGHAFERIMWNYDKSNFDTYRDNLKKCNFEECFQNNSIDAVCESWNEKILKVAYESLINKKVIVRPMEKPWYNSHLRKLKCTMNKLHKVAKVSNSVTALDRYKESCNCYFSAIKQAKEHHEKIKHEAICNKGEQVVKVGGNLLNRYTSAMTGMRQYHPLIMVQKF